MLQSHGECVTVTLFQYWPLAPDGLFWSMDSCSHILSLLSTLLKHFRSPSQSPPAHRQGAQPKKMGHM